MAMESFVSATDYHGDRHDPKAAAAFRTFVEDFKPKFRVFKGDLWDFRALRTGASKEEKMHSMRADFLAGMEFLEWYRPKVLILGNHDQRLWDAVQKDGLTKTGPLVDLASMLIEDFEKLTKKLGTIVLPYDKRKGVFSKNGLKFTHGFDGMDPRNMAAIYGDVLYGHGHQIMSYAAPSHSDVPPVARMVGCLCRLDMAYNRGQTKTLAQQHGWAYGAFIGRKKHEVFQARRAGNQFLYADELKAISV